MVRVGNRYEFTSEAAHRLGTIVVTRRDQNWWCGILSPGPDFEPVRLRFEALDQLANDNLLSLLDDAEQQLARLGLRLKSGDDVLPLGDVQLSGHEVSFRCLPTRFEVLPAQGRLMISTDLHGNLADFRALEAHFLTSLAHDSETHWALLGDFVHGPDSRARAAQPELYDYPDQSGELVVEALALAEQFPRLVHVVLGNHDYGHVGGPHTSKFYLDEVAALEARASGEQLAAMRALFHRAKLALAAPCGVLLSHGSPDAQLPSLLELDGLRFPIEAGDPRREPVQSLLCSYGQTTEETNQLLRQNSAALGLTLTMVIHGHDRDASGWYVDGGNQAQPVIFGAPKSHKRFLQLDLASHYSSPHDFREGVELRSVY